MTARRFGIPDGGDPEDVGGGVVLLHYEDGTVRVEHECGRWADEQEPDGELVKVVAPPLHANHVVHARKPSTITASIPWPYAQRRHNIGDLADEIFVPRLG